MREWVAEAVGRLGESHSFFIPPREATAFVQGRQLGGYGHELLPSEEGGPEGSRVVIRVHDNSPSAAAGVRMGGLALNNIVVMSAAATPLLYALPAGAIIVSLIVIRRSARQKGGPAWTERLVDPIVSLGSAVWSRLRPRRLALEGHR